MKALIVVDMPDGIKLDEYNAFINVERMCIPLGSLGEEKIYSDYFTFKFKPLRPIPQEQDIYEIGMDEEDTNAKRQWNKGWNACLREILGETE